MAAHAGIGNWRPDRDTGGHKVCPRIGVHLRACICAHPPCGSVSGHPPCSRRREDHPAGDLPAMCRGGPCLRVLTRTPTLLTRTPTLSGRPGRRGGTSDRPWSHLNAATKCACCGHCGQGCTSRSTTALGLARSPDPREPGPTPRNPVRVRRFARSANDGVDGETTVHSCGSASPSDMHPILRGCLL